MRLVQIFVLSLLLFSYLHAEKHLEILRIEITKVETQALGKYDLIYYAYGNIYRRLVYPDGKSKKLDSLHNVFLGELKDMRKLEKMGWYFVGSPNEKVHSYFRWGRPFYSNGKAYNPFMGLQRNYRDKKQNYSYEENYYGNDYQEDYENDNYENDNYENDNYENDNYENDDFLITKKKTPSNNFYHEKKDEQNDPQWLNEDLGRNVYEEDYSNDPLVKELKGLIHLINEENSFSKRVDLFAQIFPQITQHQKRLAKKIDLALEGFSLNSRIIFYGTGTQYCIRNGITRGFHYYLSHLHKATINEQYETDVKVYSDGTRYLGEWYQDRMHGYGSLVHANGSKYTGQWQFGVKHGVGLHEWADGSFYIGDWNNNKQNGYGTLVLADGEVYQQGWWRNNLFIGKVYNEQSDFD